MAEEGFAGIRAITDLEDGIRTFSHHMADANGGIEHTIDLYFQNFDRGLQILEERLQRAEENLERAEIALDCQRNKRVLVRDCDGDGWHWEQADCSAEKTRVAHCKAVRNKCRCDVDECRRMISDARTKRYIHEEKFSQLENGIREAVDKIGPAKELVEKHFHTSVPSSSTSSSRSSFGSFTSSSSASAASVTRGADMPRPTIPSSPSYGPRPTPNVRRPRPPQNDCVNPMPSRPVTEADRPRSPFVEGGRVTRDSVSSFKEGLEKIRKKYQEKKTNE